MADAVLTPADAQAGLQSLLALGTIAPAPPAVFAPGPGSAEEDVSVTGVMLLSAVSVLMAIMAMVTLALFVLGCWWLISHVPVHDFIHLLWSAPHATRG